MQERARFTAEVVSLSFDHLHANLQEGSFRPQGNKDHSAKDTRKCYHAKLESTVPQAAGGVCLKVTGKIPARRINTQIDGGEDLRARQLPEQVKKDKEEFVLQRRCSGLLKVTCSEPRPT